MNKEERDQEIREQALKSALNQVYGEDMGLVDYLFMGFMIFCAVGFGVAALSQ